MQQLFPFGFKIFDNNELTTATAIVAVLTIPNTAAMTMTYAMTTTTTITSSSFQGRPGFLGIRYPGLFNNEYTVSFIQIFEYRYTGRYKKISIANMPTVQASAISFAGQGTECVFVADMSGNVYELSLIVDGIKATSQVVLKII